MRMKAIAGVGLLVTIGDGEHEQGFAGLIERACHQAPRGSNPT